MRTLLQDLRYAARTLSRSPGFTAVAIAALALGIGANTAVFTVVNGVLLRPLPFPDPARLLLLSNAPDRGPFGPGLGLAEENYLDFRRQDKLFDHLAVFTSRGVSLTGRGEPAHLPSGVVTSDFFTTLGVNAAMGTLSGAVLLQLLAGGVPGAILGAFLAGKVPSKKLRMGLSGAMALLGANLFYKGFF